MSEEEKTQWTAAEMGRKGGRARSEAKAKQIEAARMRSYEIRAAKPPVCSCDAHQRTGEAAGLHRSRCPVYKREYSARRKAEKDDK